MTLIILFMLRFWESTQPLASDYVSIFLSRPDSQVFTADTWRIIPRIRTWFMCRMRLSLSATFPIRVHGVIAYKSDESEELKMTKKRSSGSRGIPGALARENLPGCQDEEPSVAMVHDLQILFFHSNICSTSWLPWKITRDSIYSSFHGATTHAMGDMSSSGR